MRQILGMIRTEMRETPMARIKVKEWTDIVLPVEKDGIEHSFYKDWRRHQLQPVSGELPVFHIILKVLTIR